MKQESLKTCFTVLMQVAFDFKKKKSDALTTVCGESGTISDHIMVSVRECWV